MFKAPEPKSAACRSFFPLSPFRAVDPPDKRRSRGCLAVGPPYPNRHLPPPTFCANTDLSHEALAKSERQPIRRLVRRSFSEGGSLGEVGTSSALLAAFRPQVCSLSWAGHVGSRGLNRHSDGDVLGFSSTISDNIRANVRMEVAVSGEFVS